LEKYIEFRCAQYPRKARCSGSEASPIKGD
jgi:hypothetical protein